MILDFSRRTKGVLHVPSVLDLAIFAIHDERNPMVNRHFHWKVRLAIDERLKRISQMQECELGQQAGNFAIRRTQF